LSSLFEASFFCHEATVDAQRQAGAIGHNQMFFNKICINFVEFQIAGFEEYESRLNSVKTELEEGDPSVTVRPFCMAILSGSLKIFHVTI